MVAVYDWSGFYAGVNGGGGAGQTCWNLVSAGIDAGCHNVSGGLAGGQIGYNWQSSNLVIGVELSGDWANLTGSNVPVLVSQGTHHSHVSGIFMATARAGYAFDRALLYVRGGAAWVRQNYFITCNGITAAGICLPVGFTPITGSETRVGGVVGAGFEYAVTNNVIFWGSRPIIYRWARETIPSILARPMTAARALGSLAPSPSGRIFGR